MRKSHPPLLCLSEITCPLYRCSSAAEEFPCRFAVFIQLIYPYTSFTRNTQKHTITAICDGSFAHANDHNIISTISLLAVPNAFNIK